MSIRITRLPMFAAAVLALAGARSDASFTYTSAQSPTGVTVGLSTLSLTGNTGGPFSGTTNINSVNVALISTAPATATNTFSLTFTDTVTISPSADGPVILTVNETLNFTRSDAQGSQSTLVVNTALPIVGQNAFFRYTLTAAIYAQPTVNGSAGNISYTITETPIAVPEPASVGMVAMGLGAAGFVGVRRRRDA